jgi:uncharacterized protein YkwD
MDNTCRMSSKPSAWLVSLLIAAVFVAGCSGGGGGDSSNAASGAQLQSGEVSGATPVPDSLAAEAGMPEPTGVMATDGYNWINFRRQQMGLAAVSRNTLVDQAAQAHSNYQALINDITHEEVEAQSGFTGVSVYERLIATQYSFPLTNFAYGEIIVATGDTNGFNAAEDLITSIYHRFVLFEPKFLEAGAGVTTGPTGRAYFTIDFASRALRQGGLGSGRLVTYPSANQQNLPTVFYSDQEQPDPVPDRNEVGYPVSVHADITSSIQVQTFTISPRGGTPLTSKLLTRENDGEIGYPSVAAIIPLAQLQPQSFYDVQFIGSVDSVPVNLFWSFKTR